MLGALDVTPTAEANAAIPPATSMARSRGVMSGFGDYHDCDTKPITNVLQARCVITLVKSIAERMKEAREAKEMTQEQLALAAGVSQSTVGNVEAGTRKQPRELLALAAALGVRPEWLLNGELPQAAVQAELGNVYEITPRKRVPLIDWIRAGHFGDIEDNHHAGEADEWVDVYDTKPGESSFALRVTGDSMTSPHPGERSFPEGTVIVVDPLRGATAGDYVVAKDVMTQKATFKKLTTDGGRWFLKPLNPSYPIVEIDDPALRVIGRVIEAVTRQKL